MRSSLAGLIALVLLVTPVVALAQPSAADLEAARDAFREGVAAGAADHWDEALVLFQRAHALTARADVLLNVAAAQIELGMLVPAAATYRRFEATADPAMLAQHGDAVTAALADLDARTPRVTIVVEPLVGPERAMLDGEPLAADAIGVETSLDPGDHVATLVHDGATYDTERFTLAERDHRVIVLDRAILAPPVADARTVLASPPERHDDPTLAIVLGVVGGLLVVGGAVTLGVVLGAPTDAPSYLGNVSPFSIDVR